MPRRPLPPMSPDRPLPGTAPASPIARRRRSRSPRATPRSATAALGFVISPPSPTAVPDLHFHRQRQGNGGRAGTMELCCSGVVSGGGGAAGAGTLRAQKSRNPPGFLLAPPRRRPSSRQLASPSYNERVGRPGDAGSVVHMLRSAAAADPAEALELFLYVARQTRVVDTTESCNYMLEVMRTHGRVGDVAHVLDIMQRQIVKANVVSLPTGFRPQLQSF
ncbi:hypothetical protein ZWY2020_036838 [Hordeum vulgare]|nr:hypothetical protein ZWY2020_036838 [Hordeum vulgare]